MKYGIIAAGNGERLASEGVQYPKPLVPLCGVPLIERLIRIFARHNAESISVIINSKQPQTLALLQSLEKEFPLDIVVKDTPGSMHSLYALADYLRGECFCVTTVDTVFAEEDFAAYINALENCTSDGIMAVTDFVDDEKPLYVQVDEAHNITAFLDEEPDAVHYISGGIYGLKPKALDIMENCIADGRLRMRNFQRSLIAAGMQLTAFPFGKIIDIDHACDIEKAEDLILNSR